MWLPQTPGALGKVPLYERTYQIQKPRGGRQRSSGMAAFDPAYETPDMDAGGEREPVVAHAAFGFVGVLRPLRHEAFEARQIDQPARQRRSFETIDIGGKVI